MLKQALYTYVRSVNPKNYKLLKDKTYRMILMVLFIVIPVLTTGLLNNINNLYTATKYLPLVLLEISNIDGAMRLPKVIYLAPMQQEDRRKYVNMLLIIKISAVTGLAIGLDLLWGIVYGTGIHDIILNTIIYTSIGIAVCVGFRDGKEIVEAARNMLKSRKWHLGWNLANICIGLILILGFLPGNNAKNEDYLFQIHHNIWCILLLMLIIDYKILKNNYQIMIQAANDYETAYLKKECQ